MRKNREKEDNGTYFVKSSIVPETAKELCSEETQSMFMEVIEHAMVKFNILIENFIILKEEFQIVIKTIGNTDISLVMQWIKQVFSIRFNRKFNRFGTVWTGRFKSVLLKIKEKVQEYVKIINDLPIKLKLCLEADDFHFSGLFHIKNRIKTIIKKPHLY